MNILRAYAVTVIICLSLTSIISGIFIADENTRKISLGTESTVVVMGSSNEKVSEDEIDIYPTIAKLKNAAKKAAGIAPPPISNIYWLIEKCS